jgi:hypothetical protein
MRPDPFAPAPVPLDPPVTCFDCGLSVAHRSCFPGDPSSFVCPPYATANEGRPFSFMPPRSSGLGASAHSMSALHRSSSSSPSSPTIPSGAPRPLLVKRRSVASPRLLWHGSAATRCLTPHSACLRPMQRRPRSRLPRRSRRCPRRATKRAKTGISCSSSMPCSGLPLHLPRLQLMHQA